MHYAPIAAGETTAPAGPRDRAYHAIVAGLWLFACAVLTALHWHNIATFAFPDVDDQLRLVEVRDWLGGQGFTDVSQHRMNQPFGAPMHWSRLVDMPIAALFLALRPILGAHMAELAAVVTVPLLTLGVALLFTGLVARRLGGRSVGLLATALGATAIPAVIQMQPMRIDHHGWEIALSLIALHGALRDDARRGAIAAGLAAAVAMQISLEVLPFAVALGGALGLHWLLAPDARTRTRLALYVGTLAAAEWALFAALHGPGQWGGFCDAVSPPHLIGLALAGAGVALVTWGDPKTLRVRAVALGAVALAAGAAFRAIPPHCGTDAFSSLEPIVRTYWYEKIAEGQPIWREDIATAAGVIGFPLLVALPCALFAWRDTRRAEWGLYTAMLLAATAVAVTVLRAGALANLVAVPAAAWAAMRLLGKAQASDKMLVRVFGSVAILIGLSPWAVGAVAAVAFPEKKDAAEASTKPSKPCNAIESFRALRALPTGRIFAPLDFGPAILLETPDAVLASSHHRNHAAMAAELTAWLGSDETAHRILRARGLATVVACPDYAETDTYAAAAPHGFAAHLKQRRAPAWLVPVNVPGSRLSVWRVTP